MMSLLCLNSLSRDIRVTRPECLIWHTNYMHLTLVRGYSPPGALFYLYWSSCTSSATSCSSQPSVWLTALLANSHFILGAHLSLSPNVTYSEKSFPEPSTRWGPVSIFFFCIMCWITHVTTVIMCLLCIVTLHVGVGNTSAFISVSSGLDTQ